jgi:IS30 family transposase
MALELTPEQAARWEAHKANHKKRMNVHRYAITPEEKEEIREALKNRIGSEQISKKTGRNWATISPIYTEMAMAGEI